MKSPLTCCDRFYNLGLAYSFDRHYGKAIEYFNKAVDVIRLRIDSLKKDSDESSKSSELKELEELLPEMMAKVEFVMFVCALVLIVSLIRYRSVKKFKRRLE